MRSSLISFALPALLLIGCSTSARLQSSFGNKYRYAVSMVAPTRSRELLFRDNRLIIQFRFDDPAIRFQAQNISTEAMRLELGKALLGLQGSYTSVRNLSTFYDTSTAVAVSRPIPPLGVVREVVLPTSNVWFDGKQWHERDLLPTTDGHSLALQDSILKMAGGTVDVILPVAFGSHLRSYHFTFSIDSVKQMAWDDYRLPAWLPPRPPARELESTSCEQIAAAILVTGFLGFFTYMLSAKKTPVSE